MINPGYDRIWDCCCDHGLLGMSLMQNQYASEVIFVDVVESITEHLTDKLTQNFPRQQYNWQVRCDDVNNLAVPPDDSQLFIIAGVGPDQTIDFINSLCASAKDTPIDLLTCLVSGNYAVRKALIHQGYKLNSEQLIFDNNRFYEAIYVSKSGDKTPQDVGSDMWQWDNPVHRDYFQRVTTHYEQKAKNDPVRFQPIVKRYRMLRDTLN
jgi:tRNA (adenine22-N1)-methyltransferase